MRRDPGLDAARALAMLGVLLAHAALPYLSTEIGWAVRDTSTNRAVDLLVWTARQFLMPTFFLVAGWLAARTVARAGVGELLRNRARRLLLPLALFLVPMSIAMNGLWGWGRTLVPYSRMQATVPELTPSELPVTLGHLWYLWYLIALTLVGVVAALGWRRAPERWRRGLARAVRAIDRAGLTALVVAVPTTALLAAVDKLQTDTPLRYTIAPIILAYFGAFYAWGWWLGAVDAGRDVPPRGRGPLQLACAAGVIAALVPPLIDSVGGARPSLPALAGAALSSWLLVNGLVNVCRRVERLPAPLAYLGVASFWTYLVHLPLVILLSIAASQVEAPGPFEFVVAAALGLATSLATFELARRTPLGRLIGLPTAATSPPTSAPSPRSPAARARSPHR